MSTTTATCAGCPTDGTLSITSTYVAGQCRNFRVTTTTTTRTVGPDGQGVCNCPDPFTTTESATCDCPLVSATTTISEPSIECPWGSTATETVTKYDTGNSTAYPRSGTPASNIATATGTLVPTSTCSLSSLPESFYLIDSLSGYLAFDASCNKTHGCPFKADAVRFHINETDPGDISDVSQLSIYANNPNTGEEVELGAYVSSEGGHIQYFGAGDVPEGGDEDWYIVTASFSTYLCQLSLITWNLHDLSTPQDCGGVLSLGYGFGEDECPKIKLMVESA